MPFSDDTKTTKFADSENNLWFRWKHGAWHQWILWHLQRYGTHSSYGIVFSRLIIFRNFIILRHFRNSIVLGWSYWSAQLWRANNCSCTWRCGNSTDNNYSAAVCKSKNKMCGRHNPRQDVSRRVAARRCASHWEGQNWYLRVFSPWRYNFS